MNKPTSSTGWDVPWTYRDRGERRWDLIAARTFSLTGILGLPFMIAGLYFSLMLIVAGDMGTLLGFAFMGFLAMGVRLLVFNIKYLMAQRRAEHPSWASNHWTWLTVYHVLLGLASVVLSIGLLHPLAALMTGFYGLLTFIAFKARVSQRVPPTELDQRAEGASGERSRPLRQGATPKSWPT